MILPVFSISIPIYRHKQPKRQYLSIYRGQLLEKIGQTDQTRNFLDAYNGLQRQNQ